MSRGLTESGLKNLGIIEEAPSLIDIVGTKLTVEDLLTQIIKNQNILIQEVQYLKKMEYEVVHNGKEDYSLRDEIQKMKKEFTDRLDGVENMLERIEDSIPEEPCPYGGGHTGMCTYENCGKAW